MAGKLPLKGLGDKYFIPVTSGPTFAIAEPYWSDLMPNGISDTLQGAKTNVGNLVTSALSLNQLIAANGITANLTQALPANSTILLDNGSGSTQMLKTQAAVAAGNPVTIPLALIYIALINASYPQPGTTIYLLTGTKIIDQCVTWAQAQPGRGVKLRPQCGIYAPAWAKALAADSGLSFSDGSSAVPAMVNDKGATVNFPPAYGTTGPYWVSNGLYRQAFRRLNQLLAAAYDGVAVIQEVEMTGVMQVYAELMLRGMRNANKPNVNSIEMPGSVYPLLRAGYTFAADAQAHQRMIDDAAATWVQTQIGMAGNNYDHITDFDGPRTITSMGNTGQVNFSPNPGWASQRWKGGALFIYRLDGVTTTSPLGTSSVVNNNIDFTVGDGTSGAVTTSDGVYVAGVVYPITAVAAHTLTVSGGPIPQGYFPSGLNLPFVVIPNISGVNAGNYPYGEGSEKITSSGNSSCNIGVAAATTSAFVNQHCFIVQENSDEAPTWQYGFDYANQVLGAQFSPGNNSIRQDTALQPGITNGDSLYGDLQALAAMGRSTRFQLAVDTNASGNLDTTLNPIGVTIPAAIAAGARYIELQEPGYFCTDTGTTNAAGSTTTSVDTTKNWFSNQWGRDTASGMYGIITYTGSGNSYFVLKNSVTIITIKWQVGNSGQTTLLAADQGSGKTYTIANWDFQTAAQLAIWDNQLRANPA